MTRKLCLLICAAILLVFAPACDALAKETALYDDIAMDADEVRYIGRAKTALMVRESADASSEAVARYAKGARVRILAISSAWARVRMEALDGYVQSRYLSGLRLYDAARGAAGGEVSFEEPIGAVVSVNGFVRRYTAHALAGARLYDAPDGERMLALKKGDLVYVNVFLQSGWALCEACDRAGYIPTNSLFRVDRLDPFAPLAPGCEVYPCLARISRDTVIRDAEGNALQALRAGSRICVRAADQVDAYETPYLRGVGFIARADVSEAETISPYEGAQPGDLIAVMTTYYAPVGYPADQTRLDGWRLDLGRAHNIGLSARLLDGLIVAPGGRQSVNGVIGPYEKETGYRLARIIGGSSATGHGGGVCQTSTTLYGALCRIPAYINERNIHSYRGVDYVPQGMDSALANRGSIDLIFTNVLPYAMRIAFHAGNGYVTACLYRCEGSSQGQ